MSKVSFMSSGLNLFLNGAIKPLIFDEPSQALPLHRWIINIWNKSNSKHLQKAVSPKIMFHCSFFLCSTVTQPISRLRLFERFELRNSTFSSLLKNLIFIDVKCINQFESGFCTYSKFVRELVCARPSRLPQWASNEAHRNYRFQDNGFQR